MKNVVWFSFLVMVVALWSCGGKVTDDVRADRPDTIVMKLGPDSTLAVIGKASTAERLQLVLKFQNEFPDTVNVALPDALKPKKAADGEKTEGPLTVGKVVIAKISREESGEYVLHGITDVTEPYLKACERYIATWTTTDSIAVELTIAQGGKASVQNAKKTNYSEWQPICANFKPILLKGTDGVRDTATVTDGKLTLRTHQTKSPQTIIFVKSKKKQNG